MRFNGRSRRSCFDSADLEIERKFSYITVVTQIAREGEPVISSRSTVFRQCRPVCGRPMAFRHGLIGLRPSFGA